MNEPQVWTLIGVFAAGLFGMLTIVSTMFVRILRSEIGGLRSEIGGLGGELRGEIGGLSGELRGEIGGLGGELRGEMGAMRAEVKADIASLRGDIRNLDRDVNSLMKHTFGIDRD